MAGVRLGARLERYARTYAMSVIQGGECLRRSYRAHYMYMYMHIGSTLYAVRDTYIECRMHVRERVLFCNAPTARCESHAHLLRLATKVQA